MDEPIPFASMILSRPNRRPELRRGVMIGLALAVHAMMLGAVLIAPFLTLEMRYR